MSKLCWYGCTANEIAEITAISNTVLDPSQGEANEKIRSNNCRLIKDGYILFLSMLSDLSDQGVITVRRKSLIRFLSTHTFLEFLQLTEDWEDAFLSEFSSDKPCTAEMFSNCRFYNVYITFITKSGIEIYRVLRQLAKLLKKLRLDRSDLEVCLIDQLIADDMTLDDRLDLSEMTEFVAEMKQCVSNWTVDMDLSFLPFRHGTGAVANKAPRSGSLNWKDDLTVIDRKVEIAARLTRTSLPRIVHGHDDLPSKQVFVPKTAKTLRGICEESVSRQFFQQGVMRYWYRYIKSNYFLRRHFPIHDQTVNQNLASYGSRFGHLATLDLSKASDTVSWKLVRKVFQGSVLYPWMIATRATSCKYRDGRVLSLHKFAPMGSALCFPTECFIFGAVVQVILDRYKHRFPTAPITSDWSVYGDDIIIPVEIVEPVMLALTKLGFIVNAEKSYWQGPFRESCGGDYFFGEDVTPLYIRELPNMKKEINPEEHDRLIQYANHSFQHGYSSIRKMMINRLLVQPRTLRTREKYAPVIFSYAGVASCVWTDFPEIPKGRFNKGLWRSEIRALVCKTQVPQRPVGESNILAYYRSLIELEWSHPSIIKVAGRIPMQKEQCREDDRYRKQRMCWGLRSVCYLYLNS